MALCAQSWLAACSGVLCSYTTQPLNQRNLVLTSVLVKRILGHRARRSGLKSLLFPNSRYYQAPIEGNPAQRGSPQ